MASKIIIDPSAPHDPAAVAWLAQLPGHKEVPQILKVNDRLALMPRRSFRPVAQEALAGERSMLGDASDLVRGSRRRSPRDSSRRLGLSEVA